MAELRRRIPGQQTAHKLPPKKPSHEAPDDVPRRKPGNSQIAQAHWRLMLSDLTEIPARCVVWDYTVKGGVELRKQTASRAKIAPPRQALRFPGVGSKPRGPLQDYPVPFRAGFLIQATIFSRNTHTSSADGLT